MGALPKPMVSEAAALQSSDLDLASRHKTGDPAAFEELYRLYEPLVFNLALRMTGEPQDAADLTQEVFLRIHRKLGGFRGRSSLKTWVFRVALNCCRSRLRRRGWRTWRREDPDTLEEVADRLRGPEERLLARDARVRVERALAQVPRVYREALVLRDLQGLTYDEVGEVLGARPGTVRSRIARGRERLRRLLEREE